MTRAHVTGAAVTGVIHLTLLFFLVAGVGGKPRRKADRRPIQAHIVVPVRAGRPDGRPRLRSRQRFRPRARKKNPRPIHPRQRYRSRRPPPPERDLEREAELEQLAEKELAEEERKPVPRGQFGDSKTGLDDPCILGFEKAVASYKEVIRRRVAGFRRPSFISPELAENLVVYLRVTFDAAGRVVAVQTVKSSGNERFDRAAEAFVRKIGSFGPPGKCVMFDRKSGTYRARRSFRIRMKAR